MKKTLSFIFAALAFCCIAQRSEAASAVRSPKEVKTFSYSTVISSVTTITVAQSTNSFVMPGAVYALLLSTGTAGDYVVLLDTNSAAGYTTIGAANPLANQIGPRYFFGSTTASTVITFDPPLYFNNGLLAWMSGSGDQVGVVFETGRGLSGQ